MKGTNELPKLKGKGNNELPKFSNNELPSYKRLHVIAE